MSRKPLYRTSSGSVEQVKDGASRKVFQEIYNWISSMVSVSGIDPHIPAGVAGFESLTPPPQVADVQVSVGHDTMTVLITPPVNVIGILYYLIETTQTLPYETSTTVQSFGPTSSTIETFPLPVGAVAVRVKAKFTNSPYNNGFVIQIPSTRNYINVMDFGAVGDGVTDDASAVQAAADYLKAQLFYHNTTPYPPAFYNGFLLFPPGHVFRLNTSIDLQLIAGQGWGIEAKGAFIVGQDGGYPIFDMLGSAYGYIDGGTYIGDQGAPPAYAFSTGRVVTTGAPAGGFYFNFVTINGHFSVSCLLNSGSEGNTYMTPSWSNMHPSTTTSIIIDGLHHYTPATRFTASEFAPDTPDSCIQNMIYNCNFNGSAVGYPVIICQAHQIKITGYAVTSAGYSGVLLQGLAGHTFRDITLDIHLEGYPTQPSANIEAQAFSAGQISVYGLETRDNASQSSAGYLKQGTNVTTFFIDNGNVFSLPNSLALFTGPVVFGTGFNFNGRPLHLAPYTPAGGEGQCILYTNTGAPSNANGANGDFCFRANGTAGSYIYHKEAGSWVAIV